MQRRSNKGKIEASGCLKLDNQINLEEQAIIAEEKQYLIETTITTLKNPFSIVLKLLLLCIVFLPWLIQISNKVKQYDFIPKLQFFLEEAFSCPVLALNNTNNTCICEEKKEEKKVSPTL
jgi:hypothetical protein